MTDLTLYGRRVETMFDLLGEAEDDITYSVGWGLAQSEDFARILLGEAYGGGTTVGELTAVRLQEIDKLTGRTDVEIESKRLHLIVEAKRGWDLPSYGQLEQYAKRLQSNEQREGCVLGVSECAPYYPPVAALPRQILGIPVRYLAWSRVAELVGQSASDCRRPGERRLLLELHRYLRRLMTVQNTTSNLVYVVTLQDEPLDWSDLTFKQIVYERNRYFHAIGGLGGWPKTPVNYLGFRFDAHLQRIQHVDGYEVITEPHNYLAEIHADQSWEPTFMYTLGPVIEPARKIHMGDMYRNARAWAALDLLLTSETITQVRDLTRKRHEDAGIPFPSQGQGCPRSPDPAPAGCADHEDQPHVTRHR